MVEIPNYESYLIDEYGNVFSKISNKYLSYYISNKGYKVVDLITKDGKRNHLLVHRLVAMTYIPNPNNYPIILHKDNNKLNTHISNLQWGTYSENNSQAIRDGLNKVPRPDNRKFYSIYDKNTNESIKICKGLNEVINNLGFGNDSSIRNYIFRDSSIKTGDYSGYFIKRINLRQPIRFIGKHSTTIP